VAARLLAVGKNLNFAFTDPLLHRQWGPVWLHLLAMLVGISAGGLPARAPGAAADAAPLAAQSPFPLSLATAAAIFLGALAPRR
jgi:hypothetical protein